VGRHTRLILALALVLSAAPAFAQAERDDPTIQDRRGDARRERRERWERWRQHGHDGVHLRVLRSYHLAADATAHEPVVVLGGDATIDGHTDDDVVVIGGTLRLGPTAVIGGDVVTVGGEAVIDPAATIRGSVDTAGVSWPNVPGNIGMPAWSWRMWPFAALSATVLRLSLVLVVSLLLTVVAPEWIRSMGVRASSVLSPGLLGAVVEVMFIPALIVVIMALAISIVGIPLLGAIPFALALGALAWTGGFAAAAACLGARLRGSRIERSSSLVTDLLIGFAAIAGLSVIAHVIVIGPGWMTPFAWIMRAAGMAVEYVAWTIGLGAALSGRFVRPRTPPPIPASSVSF